jgi:hypothetical protein
VGVAAALSMGVASGDMASLKKQVVDIVNNGCMITRERENKAFGI